MTFIYSSCSPFVETSEATSALERVLGYYNHHKQYALAVIVALQLNHRGPQIENTFNKCTDPYVYLFSKKIMFCYKFIL